MTEVAVRYSKQEVLPHVQQEMHRHWVKWNTCRDCVLGCDAELRHHVFFKGTVPANILFIGEAPGFSENVSGIPFHNPQAAGWVFDAIVDMLIQCLPSISWAVTNTVQCIPIDNRDRRKTREPTFKEIESCSKRLVEFTRIVRPKMIVTMGRVADKSARFLTDFTLSSPVAFAPPPQPSLSNQATFVRPVIEGHVSFNGCPIINVAHPSWMQRDDQDTDLELRRAILTITSAYQKLVGV